MKTNGKDCNTETQPAPPIASFADVHRSARYRKVVDGRKQPIRGLWERHGRFIARLTVEQNGAKAIPPIDTDELDWTTPTREPVTAAEIERLCEAALQPRLNPDMSEMVPLKSGRQCADQFWISRLPTSLRFLPRDGGRGFHEHCRVGRPQGRGILIGRVCGHLANEHHKRMAKRAVFTPQAIEGGKAATA